MVPFCWTLITANRTTPRGLTKQMCELNVSLCSLIFFLNDVKIFSPFLCKLCVVYISALCVHGWSSIIGPLKSWYCLPQTSVGIEYFRTPKASLHYRHCMHCFAIVSTIHLSIILAKQPPTLWPALSSPENQLVSFICKHEARFMWVRLSGLEIGWSQSLKNT